MKKISNHYKDMTKVYIITQGSYSDYHICGVYSDLKTAKKIARLYLSDNDKYHNSSLVIEEYELDEYQDIPDNYSSYFIRMTRDGNVTEIRKKDLNYFRGYGFDINGFLHNTVIAKDEKHAIKIMNELRIDLIANNKWIK